MSRTKKAVEESNTCSIIDQAEKEIIEERQKELMEEYKTLVRQMVKAKEVYLNFCSKRDALKKKIEVIGDDLGVL